MEASLLAIALDQPAERWLTDRYREQARSHRNTVFTIRKAGAIVEVSRRLSLTRCLQLEDETTSGWRLKRVTSRSSNHITSSDAPTSGNTTARASMMNTPVFQVGKS